MNFLTSISGFFTASQTQNIIPRAEGEEESALTHKIPEEILEYIFSFTDLPSKASISSVCRRWHDVSNSDFLWKDLFERTFISEKKQFEVPEEEGKEIFEMLFNTSPYKEQYKNQLDQLNQLNQLYLDERKVYNFIQKINKESEAGQSIIVQLAKLIGIDNPLFASEHIQNFGQSEEARIKIGKLVLPRLLLNSSRSFDIKIYSKLNEFITTFGFTNPKTQYIFAQYFSFEIMPHIECPNTIALTIFSKRICYQRTDDNLLSTILAVFINNLIKDSPRNAYKLAIQIPNEEVKSHVLTKIVNKLISSQNLFLAIQGANLISNEQTRSSALEEVVNASALRRHYKEAFEACNNIPDKEIKFQLLRDITKVFFIYNKGFEEAKDFMKFLAVACQKREIVAILDILLGSDFLQQEKKELALRFGANLPDGKLSGIVLQIVDDKF